MQGSQQGDGSLGRMTLCIGHRTIDVSVMIAFSHRHEARAELIENFGDMIILWLLDRFIDR